MSDANKPHRPPDRVRAILDATIPGQFVEVGPEGIRELPDLAPITPEQERLLRERFGIQPTEPTEPSSPGDYDAFMKRMDPDLRRLMQAQALIAAGDAAGRAEAEALCRRVLDGRASDSTKQVARTLLARLARDGGASER